VTRPKLPDPRYLGEGGRVSEEAGAEPPIF